MKTVKNGIFYRKYSKNVKNGFLSWKKSIFQIGSNFEIICLGCLGGVLGPGGCLGSNLKSLEHAWTIFTKMKKIAFFWILGHF